MNYLKNNIFILVFLNSIFSYAINNLETNKFPKEEIYTHVNSNFLLTGERLYYKVYCFEKTKNKLSTYSKVAYLELLNHKNQSVLTHKIKLENGKGYGDVLINLNIKSGTYKLICYTQWMRNTNSFFEENIFIINPFSSKLKSIGLHKEILTPNNKTFNTHKLLKKKSFKKREKITLNLSEKFTSLKGNFSISVHLKNDINYQKKNSINNKRSNKNLELSNKYKFIPELRGILIKGKIKPKNKILPLENIKVSLNTNDSNHNSYISKTNNKGEFFFNVKESNSSEIFLEVLDKNNLDYEILLDNHSSINQTFNNFPLLNINKNLQSLISKRSRYLQLENAYNEIKQYSKLKKLPTQNIAYLKSLGVTIKLDDYKRFPSVKELIVEILENVWYTKKDGKYKIHVRDKNKETNVSMPTLLIVDGFVIYDHNDFFNFETKEINTVSSIQEKYVFAGNIYQGVLIVNTFKNSFIPDKASIKQFNILPVQPQKAYTFTDYNKQQLTRIPDYRTQLFWNPSLKINDKITFYTSDISGEFVIEIEGFTNDGTPISINDIILVE